MKKLATILPILAALPAQAHETGGIAHLHPHGPDIAALAVIGFVAFGYLLWKASKGR